MALCSKGLNECYGEESLNWKDYSCYQKAARFRLSCDKCSSFVTSLVFDNIGAGRSVCVEKPTFSALESEIVREALRLKKVCKRFQVMMEFKTYSPLTNTMHGLNVAYLPLTMSWLSEHQIRSTCRYRMYANPLQRD